MPRSDLHRHKRAKNFLLLAVLLGIVGVLFYLTTLKIRGA